MNEKHNENEKKMALISGNINGENCQYGSMAKISA